MTPTTCILGIDPGISGAIAFYWPNERVIAVEDTPVVDGMVDAATLARRLDQMAPDFAVIELVGAMPGQGVSSMFRFGQAFGIAIGVIGALRIPVSFVSPSKWKKHHGLSADKEEARARALQMFPDRCELFARKKDHGRAEAALIAVYGSTTVVTPQVQAEAPRVPARA